MRYLLSSIVFLLLVSCGAYPKKKGFSEVDSQQEFITNPYFSDTAKDYIYKANIDAFGNSFGGIFIVKKLGDSHHRIAFTTEMGNKIFDFTFKEEEFKVNHILKELDKKILINVLKNDFRVLVEEHPKVTNKFYLDLHSPYLIWHGVGKNKKHLYHSNKSNQELSKIQLIKNGKEKVVVKFSEINDNIAQHIQISHNNIKLKISLKAI